MHKIILSTAFLLLVLSVSAQTESARKTAEKLCSPEFHGRGYVNSGDSIAAAFIAGELKAMGCQFFNNDPFQAFQFKVNTFPGKMELSIGGKTLQPGVDFVVDPASNGGIANDFNWLVIGAQELADEKQLQQKVSEAISANKRGQAVRCVFIVDLPGLKDETLKKGQQLLRELKLIAPVIELTDTKFTWSVAQDETNWPFFQVQRNAIDLTSGKLAVSYSIDAKVKNHTARNVIAYVPARKKSKNYLVYTAHYDHLGRMGQQTYFPGGNDNASGTAMLLELARHFVQNPADVNIVFIAFAGEEAGLIGSKYYTENPLFPLKKISFLFNIDIMGSGEEGATVVNATLFKKQFDLLQEINKEKHYLVKISSRGEAANSDHYFFTVAGVPAFFLYTMGPNKHYHDVYDTYDELSFAEFDDLMHLLVDFGSDKKVQAR